MNWKRYLLLLIAGVLISVRAYAQEEEAEPMIVWDACSTRWDDDDADARRVCHVTSELLRRLIAREHSPEFANKEVPPDTPGVAVICLDCDGVNAWVYPGAKEQRIYLTLELAQELGSDDELACILGHELGHLWGPQEKGLEETEADEFGIGLVMLGGYDARACPRVMQRIGKASGPRYEFNEQLRSLSESIGLPPLDEHPPLPDRIAHMEEVRIRGCQEWPNSAGCRARTR